VPSLEDLTLLINYGWGKVLNFLAMKRICKNTVVFVISEDLVEDFPFDLPNLVFLNVKWILNSISHGSLLMENQQEYLML